jgi:hypothetical protein
MATNRSDSRWKQAAQVAAVLDLVLIVFGVALSLLYLPDPYPLWASATEDIFALGQMVLAAIAYTVLGWLIGTRRPRHIIGALSLLVGLLFGSLFFVGGIRAFVESRQAGDQVLAPYLFWLGELLWTPPFVVSFTLVLQFFPDGRLPSPRWRIVPALTVVGLLLSTVSLALLPWPSEYRYAYDNPFVVPSAQRPLTFVNNLGSLLTALGALGSLLTVIVRLRRSRGKEREQMKWLVYAAAIGILSMLGTTLIGIEIVQFVAFISLPTVLALAVGVAILRHGLFDIDVIIRRTLQYTIISGLLALVYFGVVTVLSSLLTSMGSQGSQLVTVLATLTVAAFFAPLRRRVQDFIDRRFYRQKYDAGRLLAEFAASSRSEANLERLAAELLRVAGTAMQAEHVSLWLNETERTADNS